MRLRSLKYQAAGLLFAVWLFLGVALLSSHAQTPPPNDNYANRTELVGTDITFTGTLEGATLEDSQETIAYDSYYTDPVNQSVWWKWTAPVSTVLTLEVLDPPLAFSSMSFPNFLAIYTATNGATSPAGLIFPELGDLGIFTVQVPETISIPVTAGTEYEIQLLGSHSISETFRLIATNTPVIIQQPISRAVYSNECVLFYVISAGTNSSAFTFQWRFNGTNLSDETTPMLSLTNVDSSMTGDYSVIISNGADYTISQSATLTVSQSNVPVVLSLAGMRSNSFLFSLAGENGRNYRIESSTDLVNWSEEESFPILPNYPIEFGTSVIFNTNSPTSLTVPVNSTRKFYRARPYVPADAHAEICINNLRQIRVAEVLWARDYNPPDTESPSDADIQPYFPHHLLPFCPDYPPDGFDTYNLGNLSTFPICKVNPIKHFLEEVQ